MYPLLEEKLLKKLIKSAKRFQKSEAWKQSSLLRTIGFIDPNTEKKYFCNIVGIEDGIIALNIYPGESGFLKSLAFKNPYCIDAPYQQDIISFSISSWDDLNDEEYDQYVGLNFKFPHNKCFVFHRFHTGYYPITINLEEANILQMGFDLIQRLVDLCKEDIYQKDEFFHLEEGTLPVYNLSDKELVMKIESIKDYRMTMEITPLDLYVDQEISNLKNADTWELGLFYLPTPLPSVKPYYFYFPQALFVFNRDQTAIISMMIKEETKPLYSLTEKFVEVIREQHYKPDKIIFRNPETAALFTGVEDVLDCECFFNFSKISVLDDIWKGYAGFTKVKPNRKS